MFRNTTKIVGYSVLIFILVYTLIIGIFADNIARWASTMPSFIQLITYYFTQTQFILIMTGSIYLGVMRKKIFSGTVAGILLDLASDSTSTPHCVLSSGFVANAPNLTLCSDTISIRWMDMILPHIVSYSIYYWVLPILFIIIAFELLGVTKFVKQLFKI